MAGARWDETRFVDGDPQTLAPTWNDPVASETLQSGKPETVAQIAGGGVMLTIKIAAARTH